MFQVPHSWAADFKEVEQVYVPISDGISNVDIAVSMSFKRALVLKQ